MGHHENRQKQGMKLKREENQEKETMMVMNEKLGNKILIKMCAGNSAFCRTNQCNIFTRTILRAEGVAPRLLATDSEQNYWKHRAQRC
jgi:hypothetical protein